MNCVILSIMLQFTFRQTTIYFKQEYIMKNRRFISLLLSMLLAFPTVLASCSQSAEDETKNTGTTSQSVETEPAIETEPPDPATVDDLPEGLTFGGADFAMVSSSYGFTSLVEGQKGEVLNDTQYAMETYTEERLDVKIAESVEYDIEKLVMSGDTNYHVLNLLDRDAVKYALENYFRSLSEVTNIDLTKLYWNSQLTDKLAIADINFLALGCFNLESYRKTGCIFMNLGVAEQFDIEVPYEAVDNGTWTLESLEQYLNVAARDLDNDGTYTLTDAVTFSSFDASQNVLNILASTNSFIITKDERNYPVFSIFGNERFIDLFDYCRKVFYDSSMNIIEEHDTSSMFLDDRSLFATGYINNVLSLRDMESDYTVLPYPKYDAQQENYISRTLDTQFTSVLTTVKDIDMVGAVLEVMSSYAYRNLIPAYIETSLQEKYSRYPEAAANIQLCFETRTLELAEMFVFDIFGDRPIWYKVKDDSVSISSWLKSYQKSAERTLNKVIKKIEENNQ